MRETSSRSSTRRDSSVTWRPIISRAQTTLRVVVGALAHDRDRDRDRRQRVAQLVSQRGQEFVLAPIDVLHLRQLRLFSRSSCSARSRSAIRCTSSACDRSTARSACRRPRRCEQQQRDERQREPSAGAADDEVRPVGLPGAHRAEQHLAARRQPRLVDAPALQLRASRTSARSARTAARCRAAARPRECAAPSAPPSPPRPRRL